MVFVVAFTIHWDGQGFEQLSKKGLLVAHSTAGRATRAAFLHIWTLLTCVSFFFVKTEQYPLHSNTFDPPIWVLINTSKFRGRFPVPDRISGPPWHILLQKTVCFYFVLIRGFT